MWTALFNGMSVGFAIGIILRTRRLWKHQRSVLDDVSILRLLTSSMLAETGAAVAALYQPSPNWAAMVIDLLAVALMLRIITQLRRRKRHHARTASADIPNMDIMRPPAETNPPTTTSITMPPNYRP